VIYVDVLIFWLRGRVRRRVFRHDHLLSDSREPGWQRETVSLALYSIDAAQTFPDELHLRRRSSLLSEWGRRLRPLQSAVQTSLIRRAARTTIGSFSSSPSL
jgi:hypothetical protein